MSRIYCNCIGCGHKFWSDSFEEFSCPYCRTEYIRYFDAKMDMYIIDIKRKKDED